MIEMMGGNFATLPNSKILWRTYILQHTIVVNTHACFINKKNEQNIAKIQIPLCSCSYNTHTHTHKTFHLWVAIATATATAAHSSSIYSIID